MVEQAEDSIYDADYLIEPKQEMLDDTEKHLIPSAEELSNSSQQIDWTDLDQQTVKLKPIKTETILCRDIAELQKALQSSKDKEECDTGVSTGYSRTQIKQEPSEAIADLPENSALKLDFPSSKCTMSEYKRSHQTEIKNCTNRNTASTYNTVDQSSHGYYDYTINTATQCQETAHSGKEDQPNTLAYCSDVGEPRCPNVDPATTNLAVEDLPLGGRATSSKISVANSKRCNAKQVFICDVCQITFKQKRNLVKHMVTHTDHKKSHCCNLCQKIFAQKNHLTTHMRTHTGEKTYSCERCDYRSSSSTLLKNHIRSHTGEKPYFCEHCDYRSSLSTHLKKHLKTHTGEKPYTCNICHTKFALKYNLSIHMRIHTGEKPYFCEHCDYRSSHSTRLKNHLKTHTGEKPHSCNICHSKFAQKHHLTTHMRTHTGEKPYSCEHCDYRSSYSSHLKKHLMTHTGEKPHFCNICHTKFARKYYLTTHMRTHTGEKPYSCEHCDYRSSHSSQLKTHLRSHTGE